MGARRNEGGRVDVPERPGRLVNWFAGGRPTYFYSKLTMPGAAQKIDVKMRNILGLVIDAIEEKKGTGVRVLDVRGKSTVTDFMVLATGTSDPHLRAIKGAVDAALKAAHTVLLGEDRNLASGWMVVDAFDFMVHLQTEAMRGFYRLDQLWQDAVEVDLTRLRG